MRLFSAKDGTLLFSWTVIERAIRKAVESDGASYSPPPTDTVHNWEPDKFALEKTTLWDFPRRGHWAVHSGDYRGNWPPQIARNLILRYTRRGDLVVDAFLGGGTTLIEAWLLGRRSVGLDISKLAIQTTTARLSEMKKFAALDPRATLKEACRPEVIEGDALHLADLLSDHTTSRGKAKLLCVHPPYLDSLPYTTDNASDLSLIHDVPAFTEKIRSFAREVRKVLSSHGVCAVLIGDVRKKGRTVPLGLDTLNAFVSEGFQLDSLVVKTQHRDRSSEFYFGRNGTALLMAHEYLFILRKPVAGASPNAAARKQVGLTRGE